MCVVEWSHLVERGGGEGASLVGGGGGWQIPIGTHHSARKPHTTLLMYNVH
jgi:hypothetical protein